MATLYVIGNGFDLWHGLPTSYRHFYAFAKDTLDELEEHYLFDPNDDIPWYDFENALGTFNADGFYNYHNEIDVQAEDFRPSFAFALEDDLAEESERHVTTIKDAFIEWIDQVNERQAAPLMTFDDDAFFITFNYTSTLQVVYGIEHNKILHIHGCYATNDELIFGHDTNCVAVPETDDNGDSNRTMFSDAEGAAEYPLHAFKKPVDEILKKGNDYFNALSGVATVVVIGHSLNKIDLPYFRRIADAAKGARWEVSYYSDNEKESHIKALMSCGVSQEKIVLCSYEEL
jgi:hypothetical protein